MESIYTVSKKEINRRTIAYTTLILSFFLSSIVFSFTYIVQYLNISICIVLIVGILLFISRIIVIKYFNSLLKTTVGLTSNYIRKNKTKYLISNIKKIIVKRTTNGNIREMKIELNSNISTYINNSTDNVEDFFTKLQSYLSKKVIIKTIKEPIDYDHPTFYFFLGIILGFISIKSINVLFDFNAQYIKITSYCVSFLAFLLGIYFVAYKPIYKRDEKKNKMADYIWGGIFIVGAILVLLSNVF